jgi:hypothetical protein
MTFLRVLLFSVFPFLLLSCSKYGQEYNLERIKRGIPIVEKHWDKHPVSDEEHHIWDDGKHLKEKEIYHLCKYVDLKDNAIISEEDLFHIKINDTMAYKVVVCYNYLEKDPWRCELLKDVKNSTQKVTFSNITINQADSLLGSWGLSRVAKQ